MAVFKTTKVNGHGRTTIPKEFRKKFGIEEGSLLLAQATDDAIVFRPIPRLEDLAGSLSKFATVAELKQDLDRTREDED